MEKELPDNSPELVKVETFEQALEANIARSVLESHGIPSVVADEHVRSVFWSDPYLFGGVDLLVRESDAERAAEILKEIKPLPYVEDTEDAFYFEEPDPDAVEDAASESVWKVEFNYQDMILLSILALLIALLTIYW
ncbi:MAG: DUF2007 domain-containing protein [Planctomycetota bacterium]|nr:MAG: DUF2007 domain-containing protein [Planctomycetota bacterium]